MIFVSRPVCVCVCVWLMISDNTDSGVSRGQGRRSEVSFSQSLNCTVIKWWHATIYLLWACLGVTLVKRFFFKLFLNWSWSVLSAALTLPSMQPVVTSALLCFYWSNTHPNPQGNLPGTLNSCAMALKLSLGLIFTRSASLCGPSLFMNPSIRITITNVRTSLTPAQTRAQPSQLESAYTSEGAHALETVNLMENYLDRLMRTAYRGGPMTFVKLNTDSVFTCWNL